MDTERSFDELEAVLGHRFADAGLLATALVHRSFANEHRDTVAEDNERMEFLGDAVLGLVVGHMLMQLFPTLTEGELSMTRSQAVSEVGLSAAARDIDLGRWLRLGRGEEKSGGRDKASILADAFEAVVAAVYLDGGFEAARKLVDRLLGARLEQMEPTGAHDHKTRLQEAAQARLRAAPEYRVVGESGPDHAKTFEVCVLIAGDEWGRATGRSKKAAEQRAAQIAARRLAGVRR